MAVFRDHEDRTKNRAGDVGWIEGRRLLLVEDNPLNREIAEEMLMEDGFKVESAENGRKALQMIVEADPWYYSAVLMDIQMPVMDGYEATKRIRALPDRSRAQIPIIAMTANAFKEDRSRAAESGMDAYISKPVDVLTLRYVLRRVLR
jgi:CheY-like chemotaxis protein